MKTLSSKQTILLFLGVLIMLNVIIWIYKSPSNYYNNVVLTQHNTIKNNTKYKYMDTVVSVGLDNQGITGVYITIQPLTEEISNKFWIENEVKLQAAIIGNKSQFIMYVSNMDRKECILPISHELIHLFQYNTNKLKIINFEKIQWKGIELDTDIVLGIPYKDREWEKEAFQHEYMLSKLIERELY